MWLGKSLWKIEHLNKEHNKVGACHGDPWWKSIASVSDKGVCLGTEQCKVIVATVVKGWKQALEKWDAQKVYFKDMESAALLTGILSKVPIRALVKNKMTAIQTLLP